MTWCYCRIAHQTNYCRQFRRYCHIAANLTYLFFWGLLKLLQGLVLAVTFGSGGLVGVILATFALPGILLCKRCKWTCAVASETYRYFGYTVGAYVNILADFAIDLPLFLIAIPLSTLIYIFRGGRDLEGCFVMIEGLSWLSFFWFSATWFGETGDDM